MRKRKLALFTLALSVVFSACVFAVNISLGVPNLGWENGTVHEWTTGVAGGSIIPATVGTECRSMAPRSGTYTSCFYANGAGSFFVWVEYSITDTVILSQVGGESVTWNLWFQSKTEFTQSPQIEFEMTLSDNIDSDTTIIGTSVGSYSQASVTRTITTSPTFIKLRIDWHKTGGGGIRSFSVDDMTVPDIELTYDVNSQWPDLFATFTIFGVMILGMGLIFSLIILQTTLKVPFYITVSLGVVGLMLLVTTGVFDPAFILIGVILAGIIAFILLLAKGRGSSE